MRRKVNEWILSSGEFDGVVDFDAVLRDPSHPTQLLPRYDSGDHLHPNNAGCRAEADAIPLAFVRRPLNLMTRLSYTFGCDKRIVHSECSASLHLRDYGRIARDSTGMRSRSLPAEVISAKLFSSCSGTFRQFSPYQWRNPYSWNP